jgi:hypothetical protein
LLVRGISFALPLLALLGAIQWAAIYGAKHCYVGEPGKVNIVMQHRVDPELAIFGSSNSLTAFDAPLIEQVTGMSTYNFSLYGAPFVQYQALLREYLANTKNGRHVVIAETFMTFRPLAALRGRDRYIAYRSSPNVHAMIDQIDPSLAWRLKYVPLYPLVAANSAFYGSVARGYLTLFGRPPRDLQRQGFLPVDLKWDPSPFQDDHGHSERIVEQFAEVITLLAGKGLRITIVITPLEAECQQMVPGFKAHRERLRQVLGDRGAFLDYSEHPLARQSRYFYNCGHLNVAGAEAFSKAFVDDLRASMPVDVAR